MLKRQICERKLCNVGRKEHISERIGNLAVSLAGILARKVFEACQHIGFFCEERVSWRSLCVHLLQKSSHTENAR